MSKKLTTLEVRQRVYKVHGDVVTLDESTYVNTSSKCRFIDKDYGEWLSIPDSVMRGSGHLKRKGYNISKSKTIPIDIIKEKSLKYITVR